MDIGRSVVVVTGANRGLGRHFAAALLERGAAKVYAGARNLDSVDVPGAEPLRIDLTDPELVAAGDGDQLPGHPADDARLRPVIESNGGGGVLNVLSALSWVHAPRFGAYSAAKAAEWSMTNSMPLELAPMGITTTGLYVLDALYPQLTPASD